MPKKKNYTINPTPNGDLPALNKDGLPYAMAMLLRCLDSGEPFVTYGAIARELECQWKVPISPRHMGEVAGGLVKAIREIDRNAPLINLMITGITGIPGVGVTHCVKERYNENWHKLSGKNKIKLVENERKKILKYNKWDKISKRINGAKNKSVTLMPPKKPIDVDGISLDGKNRGGGGEGTEHKNLKKWVAENPARIGLRASYGRGEPEAPLLSGDSVDVLFSDGGDFVTVEVKSCLSNDKDFRRGIYQCVKYREVKQAEQAPCEVNVKAILVTERELNPELKNRAKILKVITKCVSLNTK